MQQLWDAMNTCSSNFNLQKYKNMKRTIFQQSWTTTIKCEKVYLEIMKFFIVNAENLWQIQVGAKKNFDKKKK